jgi:sugar phosphate isomerase/epimerase|tara:strand:- start:493 stop:1251 length:759 start_codon:yes stop_codon:yes gene_type:complete
MAKPISLQLYSLRAESSKDFTGVLKSVAEIGYRGVEPAGFYDLSIAEFRNIVDDLGMVVSSSHGPWATLANTSQVIETAGILGLSSAGGGFGPDDFKDLSAIKRTADTVNEMVEILAKADLTLFLHNHWWEFCEVEGRLAYDHFAELCTGVEFEIDTYWAANFGANDPVEQVKKFRGRTTLLHIKDGPLEQGKAMVAVGQGKMDIPAIIDAADPDLLRWVIVELDACDTDMLTAVSDSHRYLTENGLAEGNG